MGTVRLVDHMGDDSAVVQAARVSYGKGTKSVSDDRALIRYLMRHRHTTPFEMVEFKFHVRCPMYVARQWLRHRTANVNEISARYSILEDDYYVPEHFRVSSLTNHQGSGEAMTDDAELIAKQKASCDLAFQTYHEILDAGACRELARAHLPLSTFTEFYWKIDLHNLLHFLKLRMDDHAQKEIQDLARQIADLVRPIVPVTWEAFEDFVLGAVTFSRLEMAALKGSMVNSERPSIPGRGENSEFQNKINSFYTSC